MSQETWPDGAAFIDGEYISVSDAKISVLDWGLTHSDVTYDVVHVRDGSFFRLEDHLMRFEASMRALRMEIPHDRDGLRDILAGCVLRSGLRDAYVAMVTTRGRPRVRGSRKPSDCDNRFFAYAVPWIDVVAPEIQDRGAHIIVAHNRRIPPESIDPTVKNYHWGDFTQALFEAEDRGANTAVLLDLDGLVTEGPGFNVFAVRDGKVVTPERGTLLGITRRSVLELCEELGIPVDVRPMTAAELRSADEVFLASTAGGIMPVSRVDERILGNDRPGPVALRLKDLYWAKHAEGWHATPVDYGA